MKVLWTVNLIPADVSQHLGSTSEVLGGWVESMAKQIRKYNDVELIVACKCDEGKVFDENINSVRYFSLNYTSKVEGLKQRCKEILDSANPDIVHVEGTEFIHSKIMLDLCNERDIPAVVSMQGILNGYYNYQCGQLQMDDMMWSLSLTNIFASWILHLRKVLWYKKRLAPEREIIEKARYILGRTTWDRAHSYALNPKAQYFSCNRILRAPFYEKEWSIEKCERHSIYVGNGYYALKGLHYLVMALPQLIREYPDIKVYVAGYRPYSDNDGRSLVKKGYGAYLKKLINDLGVDRYIEFTGPLKADEVAERLAKTHTYVLTSAIENSPNSLGEAMMVGTPCISSYVGGAPDMATDGSEALFYRNDDPCLLAFRVKQIFDDDGLAETLSANARKRARVTHDAKLNAERLMDAYNKILSKN